MSSAFMALPTPADLLGASGTRETIDMINRELGSGGYFGSAADPFRTGYQVFMDQVILPIRNAAYYVANTVEKLVNPDRIRPIVTFEGLEHIPPSMHLPIVMYPPVRSLLKSGRIDGFGFTNDQLPEEDDYGRLISNGAAELHISDFKDVEGPDVQYPLVWDVRSDDPELSHEEVFAIRDTREFIDVVLATTEIDPTDAPSLRG